MQLIQKYVKRGGYIANDPFGTCAGLREKVPSARVYEVKGGSLRHHFAGEQAKETIFLV